MTEKRIDQKCPKCGSKILCREGNEIVCLNSKCNHHFPSKRFSDKEILTRIEIVREFNEGG